MNYNMNREEKVTRLLKIVKKIAKKYPDYDFTSEEGIMAIYGQLILLGVNPTDRKFSLKESGIFDTLAKEFGNNPAVKVQNQNGFCHFTSTELSTIRLDNHIKIYIPLDSAHIEEGTRQILQFLINNNIPHESKIAKRIRFDDVVVRIPDPKDAEKVLEFVKNNTYLQEGLIDANPFALQKDNIAIASDGCSSFNYTVAALIAHYVTKCSKEKNIENISYDGLYKYIDDEYEKYCKPDSDSDLKKIQDNDKIRNNDMFITVQLIKNCKSPDYTFDEYIQMYRDFTGYPDNVNEVLRAFLESNQNNLNAAIMSLNRFLATGKHLLCSNNDIRYVIERPHCRFAITKALIDSNQTVLEYLTENELLPGQQKK